MTPFEILALTCVTIVFTRGTIFKRVRGVWPVLLGCPLCTGFWIGFGGAFFVGSHALQAFFAGAVTSVCSLILHLVIDRLDG